MYSLQFKLSHSLSTRIFAILVIAECFVFSVGARAQSTYSQAYTFTTIAGSASQGATDGVGSNAKFSGPQGVAVDAEGNLYVADSVNATIRKITPGGLVSTIAGFPGFTGDTDGTNANARFNFPVSITVDGSGTLYVVDVLNEAIRKISPQGTNWVVTTIVAALQQFGQFRPYNIAVDGSTNIYLAATAPNNNSILELSPAGTNWVVSTLPSTLESPVAIACDAAGNLYVASGYAAEFAYMVQKAVFSGGNWIVTPLAGSYGNYGSQDGVNGSAQFEQITGIGVDDSGNVYVTDAYNENIRRISPVGTNWMVTTIAGNASNTVVEFNQRIILPGFADGTETRALFNSPHGLALDGAGNIYVADTGNNAIRKVTADGVVKTLAGLGGGGVGSADGVGQAARFNGPQSVTVDFAGNLFIADTTNNVIRQITPDAEVSTVAGTAGSSGTNNGVGSYARFHLPSGIGVDGGDNLYVADNITSNTASLVLREISLAGGVSTISLPPSFLFFAYPSGIAVDGSTNIYVADSASGTILELTPQGNSWFMDIIAGTPDSYGFNDGTNGQAQFYMPASIAVDEYTNLYVGDYSRIRKLTFNLNSGSNWVVTTLAGQIANPALLDGVGTNAIFSQRLGVAVDNAQNIYVADSGNNAIRKISPVGTNWVVTTIGGSLTPGEDTIFGIFGGSGSADGAGNAALFNNPQGIAVDAAGNLYIADTGNNTIRKGVFTQYGAASRLFYASPGESGQLQVTLVPPEANGQWRFPWELTWRGSGSIASNLVPGSYPVEFRSLPGYIPVPPNIASIVVAASGITAFTSQYYPTLNVSGTTNTGGLTVNIGPNQTTGSGWRFVGTSTYNNSGTTVTNLLPDTYFIEFSSVNGFSPPPSQAVTVFAGEVTSLSANYTLAQAVPSTVSSLPAAVNNSAINDLNDYPFGFNGQLQTDVGYGSGVAVSTNVVLTAAHLVFNDETLSYVNQASWFWQQEPGQFTEVPQQAEGWYVLSGYAAQRTNDLQLLNYSPDESSPQSRNEDVAALYFGSSVAGGGYGGYLPSDAQPNTWLTSTANKMLVGYPVDGSVFGTNVVNGQMYEVGPQPYPLTLDTELVTNQQEVYTATWFLSYPGNSGGPFYVELNGYYYPAGVYLGTLYNGIQPYASLVRGIDSNVVNLINLAAALGSGTNNSGGVITLQFSGGISAKNPGRINMQLGPPAAVAEGGAWGFAGPSVSYLNSADSVLPLTTNMTSIQFKPIPGWTVPPSQNVSVTNNATTEITANYTLSNPTMLAVDSSSRLGLTGTIGTTYAIQSRASLTSGSWANVSTNSITNSGFNLALPKPTNSNTIFYRALWLGY